MTEPFRSDHAGREVNATALVAGRSWSLNATVTTPLTTVHLPPERAVLTTPAMIGLMEQCIAGAEVDSVAGSWQSGSVEVRHRAGLRLGEPLILTAELDEVLPERNRWLVRATSSDGRTIGEGAIIRMRT